MNRTVNHMEKRKKNIAIVLAAGQGSRMHSAVQKQYLLIKEKPVLCYCLETFQNTEWIHGIVLVTGKESVSYCREKIVEPYGFTKVTHIVEGGKERFDSVACGLRAIEACDYVYIHDGARPFIDRQTLFRLQQAAEKWDACVAGMPAKDTVKLADDTGTVEDTPDRKKVWIAQTPQVFSFPLVKDAYERFVRLGEYATDDGMVVEKMTGHKVKMVEASYKNIKITTPEDLKIAEALCGE